jgi:hypothetical protein
VNFLSWILTTNKGNKEVSVPVSWQGVTLKQYAQLVTVWDGTDLLQLFSILSGLSVKTLNETVDPALYESLEISTRFIYNEERTFLKADKPKTITVNGKTLTVPDDLDGLTIGQSILVEQVIESSKDYYQAMPIALACCFQMQYDNASEFNSKRAIQLVPEFERMSVVEGYPIAFFLLTPFINRGRITIAKLGRLIIRLFRASSKRELQ